MQTAAGGGAFLTAAQQGMFAVDTAAGKKMVKAIEQIRMSLQDQLELARHLKNEVKLGGFEEASAIAGLDRLVASGDEQSLEFVLQRFAEALQQAQQALDIGMSNYTELEAQAKRDFRRIDHE